MYFIFIAATYCVCSSDTLVMPHINILAVGKRFAALKMIPPKQGSTRQLKRDFVSFKCVKARVAYPPRHPNPLSTAILIGNCHSRIYLQQKKNALADFYLVACICKKSRFPPLDGDVSRVGRLYNLYPG